MKQPWMRLISLCVLPMLLTGCWDRTELSDLALKMGLAMDVDPHGEYIATAQVAIPSQLAGGPQGTGGGGGEGKGYYVISGKGGDTREAIADMQTKLSRRVHAGHRRAIFIGEGLARQGIETVIDTNARDPETRLRTDLFVVKGGEGRDILKVYYPFERVPVLGTVKLHRVIGGTADTEFRDFLVSEFDDVSSPTLPVLEVYQDESQTHEGFRFSGRAIFNKNLKLIGYLNTDEALYRSWITRQVRFHVMTIPAPKGRGRISVQLTHLNRSLHPVIKGSQITIYVNLKARGDIRENTSSMELDNPPTLRKVEATLNEYASRKTLDVIHKVQQQYGADIFGFGNCIHRAHPNVWRSLKQRWTVEYPHVQVIVRSDIQLRRIGLVSSFLETDQGAVHS